MKSKDKKGVVLIATMGILLIILALVMALLSLTRIHQKQIGRGWDADQALRTAKMAVSQQILFNDARNWNIDWDDDGIANTEPDSYQDIIGDTIIEDYQWQEHSGKEFPSIRWVYHNPETQAIEYPSASSSEDDYKNGIKSAIYNFADDRNLSLGTQEYRALLEWDSSNPLDISYLGIVTGMGISATGGQKITRIVRQLVKIIPEAFNRHLIYAKTFSQNNATFDNEEDLSMPIYTWDRGILRCKKLTVPSPYFETPFSRFNLFFGESPVVVETSTFSGDSGGKSLYFDGPATINGPDTITGGLFVNGNLTLNSDSGVITINPKLIATVDYDTGDVFITEYRKCPAIVCSGNITLQGSNPITINGLIYTDPESKDFTVTVDNMELNIKGAIIAKNVTLRSNTTLTWDENIFLCPAPFFLDTARISDNSSYPGCNDLRVVIDPYNYWEYVR